MIKLFGRVDDVADVERLINVTTDASKLSDDAIEGLLKMSDDELKALRNKSVDEIEGIINTPTMFVDDLIRTERGRSWKVSTKIVAEIMESAKISGIKDPIDIFTINGKTYILNGHHRVEAARRLGINVPVNALSTAELAKYNHNIFSIQEAAFIANQLGFKVDGRMLNNLLK